MTDVVSAYSSSKIDPKILLVICAGIILFQVYIENNAAKSVIP